MTVRTSRPWLAGRLSLPGDKSLGHRLLLLAALRPGRTQLLGLPGGADLRSTAGLIRALGVTVDELPGIVSIHSPGSALLHAPEAPIDCGNSGTTARLGLGLLAGLGLPAVFVGDESLSRRPMERVCQPLRLMGARLDTHEGCLPVRITAAPLQGIDYTLPVPSAQVKSAILLAGLFAGGPTTVRETVPTRDHTERLLGLTPGPDGDGRLCATVDAAVLHGLAARLPEEITVPGDPSSAAFFLAAALGLPDSLLEIRDLLLNPGRSALFTWLQARGARLLTRVTGQVAGEDVGDLIVSYTPELGPARVTPEQATALIDEIPALAALAMLRQEPLEIRGAAELRLKECDRIAAITRVCTAFGAVVEEWPDGFHLLPQGPPRAVTLHTGDDHRIAMMATIIAQGAEGPCTLEGTGCIAVSYPGFPFALAGVLRHHDAPWRKDPS